MFCMRFDPSEIGKRLTRLRETARLSREEVAQKLVQKSKKKGAQPPSKETLRRWEVGKTVPPWDKLEQLGEVFETDVEEILFGDRRITQLREDHPRLAYISKREADLVMHFRHANEEGQAHILMNAEHYSKAHPAPTAQFHILKPGK